MESVFDEYGYKVPLGKFITDFNYEDSLQGLLTGKQPIV
jgi:hypothetical protein